MQKKERKTQKIRRNALLLSFLILFIFPLFQPIVNVEAQPDQYFLRVELEKVYGIRGETISVTAYTNYTGYNLKIINPSNVTIYNQNHQANTTQELPIVDDAEYGTYRIEARIPNRLVTTWFTVLDVKGWTLAAFPHTVEHNGLTYIFNRDWTVTVENGETLTVNLQQLAQWVEDFDLDFTPLTNDMNFLVRFSKGEYFAIDLAFSFIHTGCKIIVNGTLDRARDFTFHVAGTKLKSLLYGIRQGNLVFDWSDLKKASQNFDYNKTTNLLTVHIPKTFTLDPIIYESSFESGSLETEFDGTSESGATIAITSGDAHCGTYKCEVTGITEANEYAEGYVDISSQDEVYIRNYFSMSALPVTGDFLKIGSTIISPDIGSVLFYNDGEDILLGIEAWNNDAWSIYWSDPVELSINTLYGIEFRCKIGTTTGRVSLWFEGNETPIIDQDGINQGSTQISRVGLRAEQRGSGTGFNIILDCWVINTEYNGLEAENTAPVNYACTITDMDDTNNLYAQISEGYTLDYDGYDLDGYADISYVLVNITQDALVRACFKYTNSTDTFSLEAGDTEFTLDGSSSASRAGNVINLTIVFHVQWDAVEDNNIHLKCVIADGDSSDTDTMQTAYANIITDLQTTILFDCYSGSPSQTINSNGTITYFGSSLFPPDAEFTSVSIYNSSNDNEGTDLTIVDGFWEVSFNAPSTAGIHTYNLYIDMADTDYADGEEIVPTASFEVLELAVNVGYLALVISLAALVLALYSAVK